MSDTMSKTTYSSMEVVDMIDGLSYRMLDYWARTGRIPGQPIGRGTGSGNRRRFTPDQIERVRKLMAASRLVNLTLDEAVELLEP